MSVVANLYSIAPLSSLTATSNSSDSGLPLILIGLVLIALVAVLAFAGRSSSTVVVLDGKPAGSFLGVVLIVVALGILYFAYIAPVSGSI